MYSENFIYDVMFFLRAVMSNQLAKFAPSLYIKLTDDTGRGAREESSEEIARYFIECFNDYLNQICLNKHTAVSFLQGKNVMEYGPGDILGVALLMYAYGAKKIECYDRFPLAIISEKNIEVYKIILNSLDKNIRERAESAFRVKGNPESGFNTDAIIYNVTNDGISRKKQEFDLIISRAVIEHVNNLEKTIFDIKRSLKNDGLSINKVDLKSHGLDRYKTFDFLTWPQFLYKLMYSHKGFPNRWRVDKYRELVKISGLKFKKLAPTEKLAQSEINIICPKLGKQFRHIPPEELSWLGFWMILEHA